VLSFIYPLLQTAKKSKCLYRGSALYHQRKQMEQKRTKMATAMLAKLKAMRDINMELIS